jgi:hypothetical protein
MPSSPVQISSAPWARHASHRAFPGDKDIHHGAFQHRDCLGRIGSFKNLKSTAPQSGCHFMAPVYVALHDQGDRRRFARQLLHGHVPLRGALECQDYLVDA